MFICKFCNKECKNANSLRNHERLCKRNPDRQTTVFQDPHRRKEIEEKRKLSGNLNQWSNKDYKISDETRKKLSESSSKQRHSSESKKKISESMKIAHQEGRAWNIGKSRWNNEPSYPETFFMEVIKNEFDDKRYESEYPFSIYSLDFAWPHKKKVIEIDGEQHQRFDEYIERDKRKDKALAEEGWEVLRIVWKDMFHDTKKYIKIAKNFIDE